MDAEEDREDIWIIPMMWDRDSAFMEGLVAATIVGVRVV
jgi:hypothetical protein